VIRHPDTINEEKKGGEKNWNTSNDNLKTD